MYNENEKITDKVEEISNLYINVLKPLIILIEVNETIYPVEILNEIRGYADHISKCFYKNMPDEQKVDNINKAYLHIVNGVIDCYKILIIYNLELLDKLNKDYPTVNFHDVDNGEFYIKYNKIEHDVKEKLRDVKYKEAEGTYDLNCLMKEYEEVFLESNNIEMFIEKNRSKIEWTRLKYKKTKIKSNVAWLISIVITCILTNNNQQILQWIINLLECLKNILGNK